MCKVETVNNTIKSVNKKWSRNIPLIPNRVVDFRALFNIVEDMEFRVLKPNASVEIINKYEGLVKNLVN